MQIPNVIGNYAIGEKIGEGNYAEVKLATHCLLKQKVFKLYNSWIRLCEPIGLRSKIDQVQLFIFYGKCNTQL